MSARLRLDPGARWSDGAAIGAQDLRRTADARFVASVSDADPRGDITVRFTHKLNVNSQKRLWSGLDSIAPPRPEVSGGPFVVASYTPGLELVLHRRPGWLGGRPWIDELRLVVVPDPDTARLLLADGRLDVVMPPAYTRRIPRLNELPDVRVEEAINGGWSVVLLANPKVDAAVRSAALAAVDRRRFVDVLLRDEARRLDGFVGRTGPWSTRPGIGLTSGLKGKTITLTAETEEPMASLLLRGIQRQGRAAGGTVELRVAEAGLVEPWVTAGDYDVAEVMTWDPPEPCWTCRWGSVDSKLAAAADGGDGPSALALQTTLRDQALVEPLWRPRVTLAWRTDKGLHGPAANGWALSGAWNAWTWWVDR